MMINVLLDCLVVPTAHFTSRCSWAHSCGLFVTGTVDRSRVLTFLVLHFPEVDYPHTTAWSMQAINNACRAPTPSRSRANAAAARVVHVQSVNPYIGPMDGGSLVTVAGRGFAAPAWCLLGMMLSEAVVNSPRELYCTSPPCVSPSCEEVPSKFEVRYSESDVSWIRANGHI